MNNLDNFFMETALEHSKKSLPDCEPNPPVGCVIVLDNKIIAKGFTQKPGQAHAEVNALEEIKDKTILEQATIYVTLEPCSFNFGSNLSKIFNFPQFSIICSSVV